MSRIAGWRWLICSAAIVVAACAVAGAMWHYRKPTATVPPPLPDIQLAEDNENHAAPADPSLPEPEREFLWDVEHHGNLLNTHGFAKLADALREANANAMTALLADDFGGGLLQQPKETQLKDGCVDVLRREDSGATPLSVDRAAFVTHLLEYRKLFMATPPKVQMVLKTLLPVVREQTNGPWAGLAQLRLYGESTPGAPCEVVAILRYETDRPTRDRLSHPGWLRSASVSQVSVAKSTHYLMVEAARKHGLNPSLFHDNWNEDPKSQSSLIFSTGGAYVCDFDRDGWLDVLITDVNGYVLYHGGPDGRFVDVTTSMGLPTLRTNSSAISGVACWIDIDGDGWDDLILGGRVYRNMEGKRFVDYTAQTKLALPPETIGLVVSDYDRDGNLDIYATRAGKMSLSWLDDKITGGGNRLFRNLGNWQFDDVTEKSGAGGDGCSSFTAVWLDANNDGWPDLHVINEFGNGVLLENRGDGTFRPHDLGPGRTDYGTMGVTAGDIDNDGNIDIYCANMYSKAGSRVMGNMKPGSYPGDMMARMRRLVAGSQMHLNKGGFRFEQAGEKMQVHAVGWAYGAVLADLDNDGWLDLYATSGHMSRDRAKPDG
jgi:hypothetical protein